MKAGPIEIWRWHKGRGGTRLCLKMSVVAIRAIWSILELVTYVFRISG